MRTVKYILLISIVVLICACKTKTIYAITNESDICYNGIDVSAWQGYIDYSKVKNDGIDIVYIKSSEGNSIVDPYFNINYHNAKENALKIGFYHYLTATNQQEAQEQACFFASVIKGKITDCKLVMDYEEFNGLQQYEINEVAITFLNKVKELTGKDIIVYSDLYNAQNTFGIEIANNYKLWLAYYGSNSELEEYSTNWNYWIGRQYEDDGIINGINGYVDRDFFTQDIFDNNENNNNSNGINNNNSETIIYTVQRGNTLWQLARQYKTTIREIADLNNIQNVNYIYVGEKLKILENTNIQGSSYGAIGNKIYIVEPGDCLYKIAKQFNVTVYSIVQLNNIKNPNLIFPGEILKIK